MTKKSLIRGNRRTEVLNKNFGICVYCNEAPAEQVDHILPRSWRINNHDDNLVGACSDCNHIASDKIFDSFEKKQAYIVSELKKRKWKNRRVAPFAFMPEIIKKLQPPPKPEPVINLKRFQKPALTEKECGPIRRKLNTVINSFGRGRRVLIYENLAKQLSKLAGLSNGRVWSWNYIQSIAAGSTLPSRKFMTALNLYLEHFNPKQVKNYYFAGRGKLATCKAQVIRYEMIKDVMKELGMRPVAFKKYIEVKRTVMTQEHARRSA